MSNDQLAETIDLLIAHAQGEGASSVGKEYSSSYALGYVGSTFRSALNVLSDSQRRKVIDSIRSSIAWSKDNRKI